MPWRPIGWTVAIIIFFVLIGGVGYKIVAPTMKTVVGQGGQVRNYTITEPPKTPLGGCAIWRANVKMYWEKGYKLEERK